MLSPISNVFPSDAAGEGHTLVTVPVERNEEKHEGSDLSSGKLPLEQQNVNSHILVFSQYCCQEGQWNCY